MNEPFGDSGNFADYWLGTPSTNTRISDDEGWLPAELVLRSQRYREIRDWTSESDAFESLLSNEFEQGGGLMGSTPELLRVRSGLVSIGHKALAWEDERSRASRRGR